MNPLVTRSIFPPLLQSFTYCPVFTFIVLIIISTTIHLVNHTPQDREIDNLPESLGDELLVFLSAGSGLALGAVEAEHLLKATIPEILLF